MNTKQAAHQETPCRYCRNGTCLHCPLGQCIHCIIEGHHPPQLSVEVILAAHSRPSASTLPAVRDPAAPTVHAPAPAFQYPQPQYAPSVPQYAPQYAPGPFQYPVYAFPYGYGPAQPVPLASKVNNNHKKNHKKNRKNGKRGGDLPRGNPPDGGNPPGGNPPAAGGALVPAQI